LVVKLLLESACCTTISFSQRSITWWELTSH